MRVARRKRLVPVNLKDNRIFRLERRDFTVLNVASYYILETIPVPNNNTKPVAVHTVIHYDYKKVKRFSYVGQSAFPFIVRKTTVA